MTRVVECDFCSVALRGGAWDFPAQSFDYDEPRTGPGAPEPLEGSLGSWLACKQCGILVRRGDRERLARRSAERFVAMHPGWVTRMGGFDVLLESLREMHDKFWAHREGDGIWIGQEQLDLVAMDPQFVKEWRA